MQIAVVGTGIIGMDHLAAIADLEDFTLCAVCDINEEKARQVAVQYGVPYCTDYEKIVRIAEPDAVILNLPHFLHAPAAEYFLNCGVHVLVEKPMANTAAECDKMIVAAKSHRKVLAVGHIQRFYLVNQAVKQAADSKKLGRLLMMNERRSIRYFTENRPKWFFDRQRAGGGIIMNYGAHAIDKMFYLAGITDAAVSAAYGNAPGYEVEGHAQLFFHTPDGFSAAVSFSPAVAAVREEIRKKGAPSAGYLSFPLNDQPEYGGIHFYTHHLLCAAYAAFGEEIRSVTAHRVGENAAVIAKYKTFPLIMNFAANYGGLHIGAYFKDGTATMQEMSLFETPRLQLEYFIKVLSGAAAPQSRTELLWPVRVSCAIEQSLKCGREIKVQP